MRSEWIQQIVDALPCETAVRSVGIEVNRAGFCHCPFHADRTASMKVYPGNRGWYCFGCGAGGDVIDFVRQYYGLDFNNAIEKIKQEFGIAVQQNAPLSASDALLRRVCEEARRAQAKKAKREYDAIERRYWATFDKWLANEKTIDEKAPLSRDDDFDPDFVRAVVAREELRAELEDMEIEWRRARDQRGNY